jgi:hypothetical protein
VVRDSSPAKAADTERRATIDRGPMDSEIRDALWNDPRTLEHYQDAPDRYAAALLDQYKLYVEMADRISARRGLANTFFLTLNTLVFTLFGVFWEKRPGLSPWLLALPLAAAVGQCVGWFFIVRSYRQLNSAKYKVIGALEQRLPASPYWNAEWKALREGKDWRVYWPLTHIEQWIPVLFAVVYGLGFIFAVTA